MKPTTEKIFNWFNDEANKFHLEKFENINKAYSYNELTTDEAFTIYYSSKDLILAAINKNIFDQNVSYNRRNNILTTLTNLSNYLIQIERFGYNAVNPNITSYVQAIFNAIIDLSDNVENAKIKEHLIGFSDYTQEIKELSRIRKSYNTLVEHIGMSEITHLELDTKYSAVKDKIANIDSSLNELNSDITKVVLIKDEITALDERLKAKEQEIEDKKLKIVAFSNNIEEFGVKIANQEVKVKDIISKEGQINDLISLAESALNLKSAEGISAAFNSYLTTCSHNNSLRNWMMGAGSFIMIALILTIWIVSGKWIDHPDAVSSIVGRVVAVAISITGATFCAKQYVKQKNILEDYAYKSVLAKSIVAFTSEIKKSDATKVAEYLTQVLKEIHKDPLRDRGLNESKNNGLDTAEIIEKAISIKK